MDKIKNVTAFHLKWIAMITMCIDHAGYIFSDWIGQWYPAFRTIGRFAFPLYCFMLCEGFLHTRDKKAYGRRLFLLMLLAEPCFDLAIHDTLVYLGGQSVMVTLFIGYLFLNVWENTTTWWFRIGALVSACGLAVTFHSDYSCAGILFICTMNLLARGKQQGDLKQQIAGAVGFVTVNLLFFSRLFSSRGVLDTGFTFARFTKVIRQDYAVLVLILLLLYNGTRGYRKENKLFHWFYTLFYPAHLLVLYCIRQLLCAIL